MLSHIQFGLHCFCMFATESKSSMLWMSKADNVKNWMVLGIFIVICLQCIFCSFLVKE